MALKSEVFVGKPYQRQQILNIENVYFRHFREIVENGLRGECKNRPLDWSTLCFFVAHMDLKSYSYKNFCNRFLT